MIEHYEHLRMICNKALTLYQPSRKFVLHASLCKIAHAMRIRMAVDKQRFTFLVTQYKTLQLRSKKRKSHFTIPKKKRRRRIFLTFADLLFLLVNSWLSTWYAPKSANINKRKKSKFQYLCNIDPLSYLKSKAGT